MSNRFERIEFEKEMDYSPEYEEDKILVRDKTGKVQLMKAEDDVEDGGAE